MKNKIYFFVVTFISFNFCVYLFFNSLDYNVNTNENHKRIITYCFPQGWGFFTKSPRESKIDVYKKKKKKWEKITFKNASKENVFGFSRKSRIVFMETMIINQKIKEKDWKEYKGIENLNIPTEIFEIDNANLNYLKNEEFILIKSKTLPWSWKADLDKKFIPYQIIHIKTNEK